MYKDSNILSLKRVADVLFLGFTHMLVVTNMSVFITNLILFINCYLVQLPTTSSLLETFSSLLNLICKISLETLFAIETLEASGLGLQSACLLKGHMNVALFGIHP